jgi:hypothetical protein
MAKVFKQALGTKPTPYSVPGTLLRSTWFISLESAVHSALLHGVDLLAEVLR